MAGAIAFMSTGLERVEALMPGGGRSSMAPLPEEGVDARLLRARAADAGAWLAGQTSGKGAGGRKRVSAIVLDVDESVCRWVRGGSTVSQALAASFRQQQQEWGDPGYVGAVEPVAMVARRGRSRPKKARGGESVDGADDGSGGGPAAEAPRGVVAIAFPDSLARLVMDAADKRGIKVQATMSLWHALASRVEGDEVEAVVAVEPGERVVWAWGRSGRLLAGGVVAIEHGGSRAGGRGGPGDESGAGGSGEGDRVARRVLVDWLSWSASLGLVPARATVVAPAGSAIVGALATRWADGTVTHEAREDGVIACVGDLADRTLNIGGGDGARMLALLSARPDRAVRRRFAVAAASLALVGIAIGGLGHRFSQQADEWSDRVAEVRRQTVEAGASLIPGAGTPGSGITDTAVASELQGRLDELRNQPAARVLRQPENVPAALARALSIIEEYEGDVTIEHIKISDPSEQGGSRANQIRLAVPDLRTGLELFELFNKNDPEIVWQRTGRSSDTALNLEGAWR